MIEYFVKFLKWLFSSNSSWVLTLATGLIAWLVYSHQLYLRKKEAAIVLLAEIRHINNAIKTVLEDKNFDFRNELFNIIINPSWDKNFQLFTRNLWQKNFEILSTFFDLSKAAQKDLSKSRSYYHESNLQKTRCTQQELSSLSRRFAGKTQQEYEKARNEEGDFFVKEWRDFTPNLPKKYFIDNLSNAAIKLDPSITEEIENITNRWFFVVLLISIFSLCNISVL